MLQKRLGRERLRAKENTSLAQFCIADFSLNKGLLDQKFKYTQKSTFILNLDVEVDSSCAECNLHRFKLSEKNHKIQKPGKCNSYEFDGNSSYNAAHKVIQNNFTLKVQLPDMSRTLQHAI